MKMVVLREELRAQG